MKLKYLGLETPIVLYKLEGKKSICKGEEFEASGEYAAELLKHNKPGKPPRFEVVETGSVKKVSTPNKRKG